MIHSSSARDIIKNWNMPSAGSIAKGKESKRNNTARMRVESIREGQNNTAPYLHNFQHQSLHSTRKERPASDNHLPKRQHLCVAQECWSRLAVNCLRCGVYVYWRINVKVPPSCFLLPGLPARGIKKRNGAVNAIKPFIRGSI